MRRRKAPKGMPDRDMILNPMSRYLLGEVLRVAREAVPFVPTRCDFYILGIARDLRDELRQALDRFEDQLQREGEGFA
ncbi:MAG TPA: hypothetical protein VN493_11680 [Thermoanaerobaculia bacterium]|nr:hypothetical protein [Thermoanaerobaculia bacterium]